MSRSAALIWVLIALILGVVVWFTQPRTVLPSAAAQFLPDFSPAQVNQIEIAWPAGEKARLTKAPLDARWILQSQPKDAPTSSMTSSTPGSAPWPAETGRVQGLLRLLSEAHDGGESRAMPTAIFLTLTRESGDPIRLAIDPNTLGGSGRIARLGADGRVQSVAMVNEQFVRALESTAIESWKSKDVLFWPPEATSAFDSRSSTATIELAKSGGAWIMHAPIAIKADAGTVEGSLLLLSKSSLDRFLPASTPHEDSWKEPSRVILIASRSAANHRDIEQIIEVGPAIDAGSRMVRLSARDAAANAILWGPELAIMNNATLEAIPAAPGAFISRISLDLPAADIASLEIESGDHRALVKRTAAGNFGAGDSTIRELLRLLGEAPASQIKILESPGSATPDSVRVRAFGPKSEPLGDFVLKVGSAPSKVSGAPAVPAIEIIDRSVSRLTPWQRPADFLAAVRAIAFQEPPP
ncbi:MAG: hypothetical protein ACREJD_01755 [Phycisphaerales bacterium]